MSESFTFTTRTDNSDRFQKFAPVCAGTNRTINIRIHARDHDDRYEVMAWGPALEQPGPRYLRGRTRLTMKDATSAIADLRNVWNDEVIRWQRVVQGQPETLRQYPFADRVDLRGTAEEDRARMWHKLAKAGHELFNLLFTYGADARLGQLGDRLAEALRTGPQVISVHSAGLVVPWPMLYVPMQPTERLPDDSPVDRRGFWGYQHLVEHNFDGASEPRSDIPYQRQVSAAAYTDHRLDARGGRYAGSRPVVAPVVGLLGRRTQLDPFTTRAELETDLRGPGRRRGLLYFCCHCRQAPEGRSVLELGAGGQISDANFRSWLGHQGFAGSPLIFVNACASADAGSASHFGRVLLDQGAGALIGPYVSVPMDFARSYATVLLCWVLRPWVPLGQIARHLVRYYANRFDNPLGLTLCLYQGIDSHFCPTGEDGEDVAS